MSFPSNSTFDEIERRLYIVNPAIHSILMLSQEHLLNQIEEADASGYEKGREAEKEFIKETLEVELEPEIWEQVCEHI